MDHADGLVDIISSYNQYFYILFNNGSDFNAVRYQYDNSTFFSIRSIDCLVEDFDGDNDQDIIFLNVEHYRTGPSSYYVVLLENNNDAWIEKRLLNPSNRILCINTFDFNDDGIHEIFTGLDDGGLYITKLGLNGYETSLFFRLNDELWNNWVKDADTSYEKFNKTEYIDSDHVHVRGIIPFNIDRDKVDIVLRFSPWDFVDASPIMVLRNRGYYWYLDYIGDYKGKTGQDNFGVADLNDDGLTEVFASGDDLYVYTYITGGLYDFKDNTNFSLPIVTNSMIEDVQYDLTNEYIKINIYGLSGSKGSLNITIPKNLISVDHIIEVTIDDEKVEHILYDDNDNYLVNIQYVHSEHTIRIDFSINEREIQNQENVDKYLPYTLILFIVIFLLNFLRTRQQ